MDSLIIEFLSRRKREIDEIVNLTFWRLMEGTGAIDSIMPVRDYVNSKILLMQYSHNQPTVASVVAEEQDIPATRPRMALSEQIFSNLKVGKKLIYTARHFELMREMQLQIAAGGSAAAEAQQALEKFFFGEAADLVPSVVQRMTVLTFQVALTGACLYTDPLTGARVELTYPGTLPALLPAALTGNARWSQAATCTPLANLETHARAMYDALGRWPQKIILRWNMIRQIADSNEAKIAVLRRSGADSTTPDTTGMYLEDGQVIDLILQRTRASEIVTFDAMYSEEDAAGAITDRYFLPDNTYLFAMDNQFQRAFVPTVERNYQPGIYFGAKVVEEAPRREQAIALGSGLPFTADPRYIASRRVA
jgi:hypothetical protein